MYTAPKDPPAAEAAAPASERSAPAMEPSHPRVAYDAPADWKPAEKSQVSAVNFTVAGSAGNATVNVTVLGNFAGREEMLVNMWRQQVGAPPLDNGEAAKALSEVPVAGEQGRLFEVNGVREGKPNRIVTAMLNRPDGTWFFKLAGDEPEVLEQKPVFLGFLKTFRFESAAAPTNP